MKILLTITTVLSIAARPAAAVQTGMGISDSVTLDSLLRRARMAVYGDGLDSSLIAEVGRAVHAASTPVLPLLLGLLGRHHVASGDIAALDTILGSLRALDVEPETVDAELQFLTAERYRVAGNADSAMAHLQRALLLRELQVDRAAIAEVYVAYGLVTDDVLREPATALTFYERAVATSAQATPRPPVLVRALLEAAHVEGRLGRANGAIERYERAEQVAREIGSPGLAALAMYHLGTMRLERPGHVDAAIGDLRRAAATAATERTGAQRTVILANQRIGDVYYQYRSVHDSALAAYETAINLGERHNLSHLLVGAYRNAGIIHAWWERDRRAAELLGRSTKLAAAAGDPDLAASNRGHWIASLARARRIEEAVGVLAGLRPAMLANGDGTLAVALGVLIPSLDAMAANAFDTGPWAAVLGIPVTMDAFFRSAIDLAVAQDDTETMLWALYEYGRSLLAAGRAGEAERTFRTAWTQAARKGRDDERRALQRYLVR